MTMPLPELTTDLRITVDMTGHARVVAGRVLVVLPYAAPIGAGRGRRYRVEGTNGRAVSCVVLSLDGQAALRPPESTPLVDGQPVTVRLRALPARRARCVPDDLRRALTAAGTSLDHLDDAAVRHLLLMTTEARDPAIRADRVRAAVDATCRAPGTGS
jgi:hypothetical protein